MSIRIKFSMEPRRKLAAVKRWNMKAAREMIQGLADELGYYCDTVEGYFMCRICPEGYIWFLWDQRKLVGESQTNLAGPGYHVAVIDFLERLEQRGDLRLEVDDRTEYFDRRDFTAMRRDYFYQWFSDLMVLVSTWDEGKEDTLCWPVDYYEPEGLEGKLITHIRPFSFVEIRALVNSGLSMAFAREFFIWNEKEKDAWYYRNCGLVLLNQTCFFMPSRRSDNDKKVNDAIIETLEKAVSMDRSIPFPVNEYLEVCRLAEHEPVEVEGLIMLPGDVTVNSRKRLIYRKLGRIKFPVPGSFLFDHMGKNGMDHYYDGEGYGGHDYYIYAIAIEERGPAVFKEPWFLQGTPVETYEFDVGEAKAKAVFYEPEEREGTMLYNFSAQVLYKEQRTNINITSRSPDEREWTLDLVRKIRIID